MKAKINDKFTNLIQAIELSKNNGSVISWKEKIGGVRFSFTVRQNLGGEERLIVVDCVDSDKLIKAKSIDRFSAKARSANAQMAIMISLGGFQDDAKESALQNGVRLLDEAAINELGIEKLAAYFDLVMLSHTFRFQVASPPHEVQFPEEPGVLSFLMQNTLIEGAGISSSPEKLIDHHKSEVAKIATSKPQKAQFSFPLGTVMIDPNLKSKTAVQGFSFMYQWVCAGEMKSTEGLDRDPYFWESIAKSEISKRNSLVSWESLRSGINTTLVENKFYFNARLQFSYFCEKVRKKKAIMVLVESIQNGQLVQARFRIDVSTASNYLEVIEAEELARLQTLYVRFTLSDKNLEGRFKAFLDSLEDGESIRLVAMFRINNLT